MTLFINIGGERVQVSAEEEARIRAEWEAEAGRRAAADYRGRRGREYPGVGDQLDSLWKIINQLRLDGVNIPQDGDDMLGRILAVKKKYPKPTAEDKND